MMYTPFAICLAIFFTAVSTTLAPFAYIYALLHKMFILLQKPSCRTFAEVLIWLPFGPILVLVAGIPDLFRFLRICFADSTVVSTSHFKYRDCQITYC